MGNTTVYYYDEYGNVVAETNALNYTTTYEYTDPDNPTSMTAEINAIGDTTKYTYDENGNMEAHIPNSGDTITYVYDELGRIIAKGYGTLYDPPYSQTGDTLSHDPNTYFVQGMPSSMNSKEWDDLDIDVSAYEDIRVQFLLKCDTIMDTLYFAKCSLNVFFKEPTRYFLGSIIVFTPARFAAK